MVYVDEIYEYETKLPYKKWCHMATDGSLEELHAMAAKLGLRREWFQNKPRAFHYDLVPSKRTLALKYRSEVQAVTAMELIERCHPELAKAATKFAQEFVAWSGREVVTQETLF